MGSGLFSPYGIRLAAVFTTTRAIDESVFLYTSDRLTTVLSRVQRCPSDDSAKTGVREASSFAPTNSTRAAAVPPPLSRNHSDAPGIASKSSRGRPNSTSFQSFHAVQHLPADAHVILSHILTTDAPEEEPQEKSEKHPSEPGLDPKSVTPSCHSETYGVHCDG